MHKKPEVDSIVAVTDKEAVNKLQRNGDFTPFMRVFAIEGNSVFIARNFSSFGKDGAKQIMAAAEGETVRPDGTRVIRSSKLLDFGFHEDSELPIVPVDVAHIEVVL